VAVNLAFTAAGARQGEWLLAVNTLLMTFYTLFSYVMDGFAFAGEALGGKYFGARDDAGLSNVIRRLLLRWGLSLALVFTALYALGGGFLLRLLTDDVQVVEAARTFAYWTWLIPLAGFAAFVYDGIFIGLTATRGMLVSSFVASVVFFGILGVADHASFTHVHPQIVNHVVWSAFIAYLAMRGVMQYFLLRSSKAARKLR